LDLCSSWVSYFPDGVLGRAVGLGMNKDELKANPHLNEYVVQDLNLVPTLPFPDNSFDYVTCAVSVDYITTPLEVFREIRRVLVPGGTAIMSFSNRCALWGMHEHQQLYSAELCRALQVLSFQGYKHMDQYKRYGRMCR
jgi:ubiquinone/menaquinone biosynthesis C-methylase UbiE